MKTHFKTLFFGILFLSTIYGEPTKETEPIYDKDLDATKGIHDAYYKILSYNGLSEGDARNLISDFLKKNTTDTITGADAKFIIMRAQALPNWILGKPPEDMPVSEEAFKTYYMKAWRLSLLRAEHNELTPCLVYVLTKYVSVYKEKWKDDNFKKLFSEDLEAYKERFPDAHVWIPETLKEETQLIRITSKKFPQTLKP